MPNSSALIYGGSGALGKACVNKFKAANWFVVCVDTKPNENSDASIVMNRDISIKEQETYVLEKVKSVLIDKRLDSIVCVAGGWAGGNVTATDFIESADAMWKQSVASSLLSASIANKFLKEDGLILLSGAQAALSPTPSMLAYGMSKAAVHHLTKSLATYGSGFKRGVTVLALAPTILDTPQNRSSMPTADTSTWTPLEFITCSIMKWSIKVDRPRNGSLIKLITKNRNTELVYV